MKKNEIEIGGRYTAKVSGVIVIVRVDDIQKSRKPLGRRNIDGGTRYGETTIYNVTNLRTGKEITFRSAQRFRRKCTEAEVS